MASNNFNPHSRTGSDGGRIIVWFFQYPISIHTPARGVTEYLCNIFKENRDFNPHSRTGSDNALMYAQIDNK